jgi:hypothetical protein
VQEIAIAYRSNFTIAEKASHTNRPEFLLNDSRIVMRQSK